MKPFDCAEVIKVIRTTLLRRGWEIPNAPIRIVTQYWTLEGELLIEDDPWDGEKMKGDE